MRTIIIGAGEIGQSLFNVLSQEYECDIYDKDYGKAPLELLSENQYDIMHIAFPYSDSFETYVNDYIMRFNPLHIVIHSTVPVGTSKSLNAIHSPCLGIHPHLEQSMKIFTKFLGGPDASSVADYFRRAGMTVYITDKSESTELMKIMSTTFYGVCIEYTKSVKEQCDLLGIPFELWTLWTNNYNQGYVQLGHPEYTRPNLVPNMSKIGGHCILPNTKLHNTSFTKLVEELNEK